MKREGATIYTYGYYLKNQLIRHIQDRVLKALHDGREIRDNLICIEDLENRKKYIKENFIKNIGGLPPMDTPLKPVTSGTVNCDGYRIERVIFESRPRNYVTANLYIPDNLSAPGPAVQFLCGHHLDGKHCEEYQTVCQILVRAGLIVLAQDPIGQGERLSYYDVTTGENAIRWGTTEHIHTGMQALLLGRSLAGYFVHDAMRGLDYLISRPEVDQTRIGVTGNSGGGTQTCLMMLCDDQIAATVHAIY